MHTEIYANSFFFFANVKDYNKEGQLRDTTPTIGINLFSFLFSFWCSVVHQIRGKVECFGSGGNYIFYSTGIYAQNVTISKQFYY